MSVAGGRASTRVNGSSSFAYRNRRRRRASHCHVAVTGRLRLLSSGALDLADTALERKGCNPCPVLEEAVPSLIHLLTDYSGKGLFSFNRLITEFPLGKIENAWAHFRTPQGQ